MAAGAGILESARSFPMRVMASRWLGMDAVSDSNALRCESRARNLIGRASRRHLANVISWFESASPLIFPKHIRKNKRASAEFGNLHLPTTHRQPDHSQRAAFVRKVMVSPLSPSNALRALPHGTSRTERLERMNVLSNWPFLRKTAWRKTAQSVPPINFGPSVIATEAPTYRCTLFQHSRKSLTEKVLFAYCTRTCHHRASSNERHDWLLDSLLNRSLIHHSVRARTAPPTGRSVSEPFGSCLVSY
jgi:hypothetical protein